MKTMTIWALVGLMTSLAFTSSPELETAVNNETKTIKWYSIEEAIQVQKDTEKCLFIDVYTDWCGWCKVMDEKTFTDPDVIEYMNKHFIAVKFNAEQREAIDFDTEEYKYIPRGKRGIHELAIKLLDGAPSYPAFVVLDENLTKLGLFKGYNKPEAFVAKVDALLAEEEG